MEVDIVTKLDLEAFKNDLLKELALLLQAKVASTDKEYLRTKEVREMLGGISAGTLQNLRIKGLLKPTRIEGVYFYRTSEIRALLSEGDL